MRSKKSPVLPLGEKCGLDRLYRLEKTNAIIRWLCSLPLTFTTIMEKHFAGADVHNCAKAMAALHQAGIAYEPETIFTQSLEGQNVLAQTNNRIENQKIFNE